MLSVLDCTLKERYEPHFVFQSKAQIAPFKGKFLNLLVLRRCCLRQNLPCSTVKLPCNLVKGWVIFGTLVNLNPHHALSPQNCIGSLTARSSFLDPGAYQFGITIPAAACISFTQ